MYEQVKEAFSLQSEMFDRYEEKNEILKWMRSVTRQHIMRNLNTGDKILELNAGTGLDAVYFASKGFKVHAIDISEGMIERLKYKVDSFKLAGKITYELLSFTELHKLSGQSFDYIFSNFGGLNCVDNLEKVTRHFADILTQGGKVTFVIMPPICPWETALILKGNFRTAFRRLHGDGVTANIEGIKFQTYYHTFNYVKKTLGKKYRLIESEGLASLSPPPYMENFPRKHSKLCHNLISLDKRFSHHIPFNRWADHIISTFQFLKTS
jgi:ubiquinone/menaquinone biosynthesis C-methylase UbiE